MKKLLQISGAVLGVLLLLLVGGAAFVGGRGIPTYLPPTAPAALAIEATPERMALGEKLVLSSCADCHLNRQTNALSGQHLADVPKEFGQIHSANITQDKEHGIGGWTDGQIVALLRTGLGPEGRYRVIMPSFVQMSDEDVNSIVVFLRSKHEWTRPQAVARTPQEPSFLLKALTNTVMKPTPMPQKPVLAPASTDAIAYGHYLLVGRYKCYDCHSHDFKTNNALEPEKSAGYLGGGNLMLNREQQVVITRNLTMDENTGLGDWTAAQFGQAVRYGNSPHGALHYPMPKYSVVSEEECNAIWAYLQTVPKIKNATPEDGTQVAVR